MILSDVYTLLNKCNIEYTEDSNKIFMKCPIHNGEKHTGCTIYKDTGKWYCWTHNCHIEHQSNLFAFFKAILKLDTKAAIDWFKKYFNNPNIKVDYDKNITNFIQDVAILTNKIEQVGVPRTNVTNSLKIPSKYFIKRGFSQETLIKYDVGECYEKGKLMYNRAVVPIYNINHDLMTGCVGRRLTEDEKYPKWINSRNFKRGDNLYNIWFAKEYIEKSGLIIICEGQGDVWRLEEAGIHNAVGIFGSALTDNQLTILESLPIFNMLILTDSDKAGIEARNKITKQCERLYNIFTIDLPKKDIGDMNIDEVKNLLFPLLEKI